MSYTKDMSTYEVGQTVIATGDPYSHRGKQAETLKVVKVGRQYVYAAREVFLNSPTNWRKFNMANSFESVDFGSGGRIYTQERWAQQSERADLLETIRRGGLEPHHGQQTIDSLTTEQLRAIAAILTNNDKELES